MNSFTYTRVGDVAGAVRDFVVRDTEIHTFSGDAIQVDPQRGPWDGITVERCSFWLAPLSQAENGFPIGVVPGENAIDTKASSDHPRARLTVRDSVVTGFRHGLIGNMAAFNLKENVEVDVLYIDAAPVAIDLPNFVELAIARTDPGVRGDTAQGGTKPATLETGAVVQVPLFLNEGDVVKVDTRTGAYLGRVATAG